MEDLLYQYNPWWEGQAAVNPEIKPRQAYMRRIKPHLDGRPIIILTGLRRAGKTTLMKLIIGDLLKNGVAPEYILYASLDDYMLRKNSVIEIINEYRKIHKIKMDEKIFLFLDEVAAKKDFHIQLKNIYDSQNAKIVAASSSASMLRDPKARLTGRSVTLEIKPLDMEEYLFFKEIEIKKRDRQLLKSYFLDYIKDGGLPENVLNPSREYLVNLVDDIIQKDIAAFYGVKNPQVLRDYFTLLMERSGKQASVNKISNILGISPDTSKRYLHYFQSAYLVHMIPRWGKTNQKILSAKKIYAADLGIKHLFVGQRDIGSYFENYIHQLMRDRQRLYYLYENGAEIDFYTEDGLLIESKFYASLNPKQEKLFFEYPAKKRFLIDSIEKTGALNDL
ncbi:AAA family ATPase [Candidatus Desulfarcum epimagneticum]|uniref:AAA family ATPase n=1 Tax=uncultured Desulfobacteraceae bacterium TaxID=218296 RepID=A0A484HJJ4_9BACT|nr:AAA family ATPase [uncultured Desulfobacteraceae bacterium]